MRDSHVASQAGTGELLDDHLRIARRPLRTTLPATAVRTSSIEARHLLARAALGDAAGLSDLLDAARAGNTRWLRRIRRRVRPDLLAGLAQTLAMQDMLTTDRRDALAVYALIRDGLGAAALGAGHQGLHVQLAFVTEGPAAARALLRRSAQVSPRVRAELQVDLLNPFSGGRGQPEEAWLAAFRALLPGPLISLEAGTGLGAGPTPFDRLTTDPVERVDGSHRISVVVTAYKPDEGLITAVRSIVAQSWRNTEVIVVDDGSPVRFTPLLERCRTLGERIRLIRLPDNVGTYAARNAGLDAAEGEFVAFQDSDDWSHPRRLELQVRALLDDPCLVASTADGLAVTADLLLTSPHLRGEGFNPSSLLVRRDAVVRRIGYFDRVRKGADSEYLGRIRAAFGAHLTHHVETGPLALIRLSENSLSRAEVRPFWLHPARAAYCSAYLEWHERIAAGAAPPHRPSDGSSRPFAAPDHLTNTKTLRGYDVVMVADWRFLDGAQLAALDELRALTGAGLRVGVAHVESYRTIVRRRLPLARAVQHLVNTGVVDHVPLGGAADVALVVVRQAAVLQFPGDEPCELRPRRVLVVADRAPARRDGTDRRYLPEACTRTARRMFGVDPIWCPQDSGVRAALAGSLPAGALTGFDLPPIVDAGGWVAPRDGATAARPVVGTDLCDSGSWPADLDDALAIYRGLGPGADVRIRLPDRPEPWPRLSTSWLTYAAADLDCRGFLHQLDLYLHFPGPQVAETFSRPALQAAAVGAVVLMPASFAATHGDTALYGAAEEVPELVARYHRDRALFVAQSDRARDAVSLRHHPRAFLERITALLQVSPPAPRTPDAGAEATR